MSAQQYYSGERWCDGFITFVVTHRINKYILWLNSAPAAAEQKWDYPCSGDNSSVLKRLLKVRFTHILNYNDALKREI